MSIRFQKPDYIIVFVSDMQRSTAFYQDVLGLPLKFTSPGWTEFNTGAITIALHRVGGETTTQQEPLPPPGNAHIGFIVDDLQSVYGDLKARGAFFSLPTQKQNSGVTLAVLHGPHRLRNTMQQG